MRKFLIIATTIIGGLCWAQEEEKEKKWLIRGYVKDLLSVNIADDSTTIDNLIHNRLNFKWFPTDQINVKVELRNRLFWGETVKYVPQYGELIDVNNDYFDLSVMKGRKSLLFHSMIDRAYVEWYKDDWELRVGRQRINWGINVVWNPNDLFNAYSFFDFDYEERPGSDALLVKKYTGVASSIEIASTIADDFDEMVIAGNWKWNKWNYDFQLLAGKAREDITFGLGWAGNIKDAGFKGEVTYFSPYTGDGKNELLASVGIDYSFESSLYLNGSFLINSAAPVTPGFQESINLFSTDRLTAKDLSPFRYATFLQTSYSFHPLINGGIATIYYPSARNALFINPSVTVSLKSNLDLDLISQLYYDQFFKAYKSQARLIFIRLKWSF
ncbi:hypothetical protein [Ekhidna sp.]|uniref:hypothetical protein n=1 Tax=Ekhidna sp. TaxID=2608089 RepID=UPI0032991350